MTAQIHDQVEYREKTYSLVGVNGGPLFDPASHGLKPVSSCTACWRGFRCSYSVHGNELTLDEVSVHLEGPAPELLGVQPRPGDLLFFSAVYSELSHLVPYSGGLLIARGFLKELYVHMGFHPAWKFNEVHELRFDAGRLQSETDRSVEMAEFREEVRDRPLEPGPEGIPSELKRWIEQCFSLEYRW